MWRKIKGSINMFVAIMLIPTVAFTGLMVDFARIQMIYAETSNAADIAASSATAYYDGLLKDVYGLFAVSQDKQAEQFAVDYAMSALGLDKTGRKEELSFNLIAAGKDKVDVHVGLPMLDEPGGSKYSLRNTAYFTQQVGQYMEYRVLISLLELAGIFADDSGKLGKAFKDGGDKAKNARTIIDSYNENILKLYGKIFEDYRNIYARLNDIKEYETGLKPTYYHNGDMWWVNQAFSEGIADKTVEPRDATPEELLENPNQKKYYQVYKDLVPDTGPILKIELGDYFYSGSWGFASYAKQYGIRQFVQIIGEENLGTHHLEKEENKLLYAFEKINGNEDKADTIEWIEYAMNAKEEARQKLLRYDAAVRYIAMLSPITDADTVECKRRINGLLGQMAGMSLEDEFREKMTEELHQRYNELIDGIGAAGANYVAANKPEFDAVAASLEESTTSTYYVEKVVKNAKGEDEIIREPFHRTFEEVIELVEQHYPNGGYDSNSGWHYPYSTLPLEDEWEVDIYKFNITPYDSVIYGKFEGMSAMSTENPAAREQENADRDATAKNDEANLKNDDVVATIPGEFFNAWSIERITDEAAGDNSIKKLLLIEYGMQNLTCHTTNRKIIDNNGKKLEDEKTLSGIPKDGSMNYLNRRELEYVAFGGQSGNYTEFIVIMLAIFTVANWLYTWVGGNAVWAIGGVITGIRCIPFVGFAIAEIYRIVISFAEAVHDVKLLTGGKKATIIKSSDTWWTLNSTHFPFDDGDLLDFPALYYDEYLRIFILFNGGETIASRITDMIELNMNNYMCRKEGGDLIGTCFPLVEKERQKIENGEVVKENGKPVMEKYTERVDMRKFKATNAFVVFDVAVDVKMPYFFIKMPFLANQAEAGFNTQTFDVKVTKSRGY